MDDNLLLIKNYLYDLLSKQLSKEVFSWLNDCAMNAGCPEGELKTYQSFARIPSVTGTLKLSFEDGSLLQASSIRKGWNPENWNVDQAARIFLLLSLPMSDSKGYKHRLAKFFEVADMNELETLCLALPLYPFPEEHLVFARQGLRSNMKTVFEAVALNNPYPAEYFDMNAWNQMVLKVLFVGSPAYKIYGIDERTNVNLACMLCDYAHERWSAGRAVSPELWRSVGPFINEKNFGDIQRVYDSEDLMQREAAMIACSMSTYREALDMLDSNPELKIKIKNKEMDWEMVARKWNGEKETVQ